MKFKTLMRSILAVALAAGLASCSSQRSSLTYFKDIDTTGQVFQSETSYNPVIQPDDELYITVSAFNEWAATSYNLPLSNPGVTAAFGKSSTPQLQTYLVDSKGDIYMPNIGKVHAAGLTCEQLRDKLVERISKDLEDPNVLVRMMNFKVMVAGEVKNPGPQPIAGERYSILDALTAAGDLTEFGERSNVLVIREVNGKRTAHRLDLNDPATLSSPYFYLHQNDYVYVEPNHIRQDNSKYNQNNAFKLSVISTIVSGCSVIASLIIALTVK